jgi:signal transduction histidine kinase
LRDWLLVEKLSAMSSAPPPEDTENLAQRREFVRRSVLRANRAIAVILGVVVLLGVVLAMMIMRARQNQARAEKAEAEETEKVWNASLAQARAENLSVKMGHRAAALEAVRTAAAIRPSLELRNEAISALALVDLVPEVQWPLKANAYGFECDPEFKYYVVRYEQTVLSMYRFQDNSHVRDFPMPAIYGKGCHVGDFMFSSTGKYLFIRYNGGGLTQWDPETGQLQRVVSADPRMKYYSWPMTFSADDRYLAMSMQGSEGTQFVYDLEKGAVHPLPAIPEKLKYRGGANFIRISPRGDLLAGFEGNMVYVFDALSGELRYSVKAAGQVETLTWDRQGVRLAFSCDNWSIFTWEPRADRVVQFGGTALLPWLQDFSEDGTLLMTAGQDGVTRLWDVVSARLLCEMKGVLAGWMSGDGRRIAGGVMGRMVGVWRVEQPAAMSIIRGKWESRATVWQMDLSTDGRYAVWTPPWWVETHGFEVHDLERGTSVSVPLPERVLAGFRPGHSQIWTLRADTIHLRRLAAEGLTNAEDMESEVQTISLPKGFNALNASFSADGRHVAVAGPNRTQIVVDLEAPEKVVTLEPAYNFAGVPPGPASPTGGGALAISPDARWVVASRQVDRELPIVWDAGTGRIVQRLQSGEGSATFSPDGKYLVLASRTGLTCYSTSGWQRLWRHSRDELLSYSGIAAFTADSSLIAATMGNSRVEFFTAAGERLAAWEARDLNFIANLRFSGDGRRLLAGGMEGRLASMDIHSLREHLKALHLDWPLPAAAAAVAAATTSTSAGLWQPMLLGLVPVLLAAVLGALVLRRQGRLTHEFVEATEVAAQRERELAAEREVSELKSRFVTTVSHEFRTPLGITMSAVELLRHYEDRLPPEEKAQLFDDIHSATRNMAGLMEQVLVLGRVDAGKLAFHPAALDLDVLARKLADESLSATNRKCPIEWRAENDLSGARADEALLRHILTNLLSNGVKYSPAGTPVQFTGRRDGREVVFTVQDRGIGIPEADLPKLFEAFHRGSNVGEIPGTGLGLVIIKRCVDLHGGSVRVESKPGEGATFTVRVPAW